ncbi:ATP binding, partial [Cryomyces antarcticus]
GSVKISDFGISKRVEASTLLSPSVSRRAGPRVSLQGSVFWMAPEVVKQTTYTRKADIWSLGCLIVEMLTGSHPHPNCTQLQAIFKIGGSDDASPTIPEGASREASEFLTRTFEIDHERRPTADELLLSSFCNVRA